MADRASNPAKAGERLDRELLHERSRTRKAIKKMAQSETTQTSARSHCAKRRAQKIDTLALFPVKSRAPGPGKAAIKHPWSCRLGDLQELQQQQSDRPVEEWFRQPFFSEQRWQGAPGADQWLIASRSWLDSGLQSPTTGRPARWLGPDPAGRARPRPQQRTRPAALV